MRRKRNRVVKSTPLSGDIAKAYATEKMVCEWNQPYRGIILCYDILLRINPYSIYIDDVYLLDRCPDQGLENVKNMEEMISAGWNLKDIEVDPIKKSKYTRYCGTETFWGYKYGKPVGKIIYSFKGDGKAKLKFGNCYKGGRAKVYLNKNLLDSTTRYKNKTIHFEYKQGDTLMVKETGAGIFIIHSLKISCNGKVASTEK